ncbi:MAG TPA: hypothetical protein VHU13_09475 [Solirubrobacteraceae bacterium]|nr:hypothetical protein [Solirubrobacteraceae bacterium]
MTQISRPFQIALAAVAMLGLVWAVALRGHGPTQSASTGTVPSAPAPAQSAKAAEKAAADSRSTESTIGQPTPIYHGAAPGVEGLTRAIAKAHGAVATSQQNAQQLQQHSREASQEARAAQSPSAHSTAQSSAAAGVAARRAHQAGATRVRLAHEATARKHSRTAAAKHAATAGRPAAQIAVEHEVAAGRTVLLLFWTPSSSVDREVRSETAAMVAGSHGRLALHVGTAGQVGEFGSITEVVHVYQTPTILIVNRRGVVSTLTGLTDTFALRQLVHEAERANG